MSEHALGDTLSNPYDFANPVFKKELFAGRANELREIRYYLDYAQKADRSINLALLGARASGKTSLLNIIELDALERSFVPARVDLNESDAQSPMAFWYKMFDSIVTRVVQESSDVGGENIFGGEYGRTYETYLDITTTYSIPRDKTFCPFVFPLQYAKAMGAGNSAAQVSDQLIRRDLQRVAAEVRRPIVLLLDEGNVLSGHRILLEMLRNTFMNLGGYMLILTGTPELFPVMDEVFSPIVRQFKRIDVAPFADVQDTVAVAREPLKALGLEWLCPDQEGVGELSLPARFGRRRELDELHELTGGRPYEIKLVCHFMFRRVQDGKDKQMRLGLEVLEDVLRELRRSHDVDARPIISAVRRLDLTELGKLRVLLPSAGKTPLDQLLFAALATRDLDMSAQELREATDRFVKDGILGEFNGSLRFRGDDFDRIVCTYAARQRGVHLSFEYVPIERYFGRSVLVARRTDGSARKPETRRWLGPTELAVGLRGRGDAMELLDEMWSSVRPGWTLTDLMAAWPGVIGELYGEWAESGRSPEGDVVVLRLAVKGPGIEYVGFFYWASREEFEAVRTERDARMALVGERMEMLGGKMASEIKYVRASSIDDMLDAVVARDDSALRAECGTVHVGRMCDAYLDAQHNDKARAFVEAERALRATTDHDPDAANSIAYVLIQGGHLDGAEKLLRMATEDEGRQALATYNLGIVLLKRGSIEESRSLFEEVLRIEQEKPMADGLGVLVIPHFADGTIEMPEVFAKNVGEDGESKALRLVDAAQTALAAIDESRRALG